MATQLKGVDSLRIGATYDVWGTDGAFYEVRFLGVRDDGCLSFIGGVDFWLAPKDIKAIGERYQGEATA